MGEKRAAVVALGMFDGMHIGHRTLLQRTIAEANRLSCDSAVYSFANHPLEALGGQPRLLMTADARREAMEAAGVNAVVLEPFTKSFAALSQEAFVDRLQALFTVRALVVGFNYTFGAQALGTPETLTALGEAHGFSVLVVPPVVMDGAPVSSSRIRALLEAGEMESAARMLTRPYRLSGSVTKNLGNGRKLGFPTANIVPDPALLWPKRGVYATRAKIPQGTYPAVTNIGVNPTLGGTETTVETHLIGFSGDLYGAELAVDFLAFLREDRRFPSIEALIEQIARDVATAKTLEIG